MKHSQRHQARLHLIYIPGLGAERPPVQSLFVKTWALWGVKSELFPANWSSDEPWEAKFDRLLARIDELTADGRQLSLVSASAGASAAINAYAARQDAVLSVVIIAGMINYPENIWDRYRQRNPAFVASAYAGQKSLSRLKPAQRRRILSLYGILDEVVGKKYSRLAGGHNRLSPTIGHVTTIGLQLLFGAPFFIHFVRRQKSA